MSLLTQRVNSKTKDKYVIPSNKLYLISLNEIHCLETNYICELWCD